MNLIPGINVGNAVRQAFDWGGDYDILDGVSVQGGERNPTSGFIGTTAKPAPAPTNSAPAGGNNSSPSVLGDYAASGAAAGGGSAASAEAAQKAADLAYLDDQEGLLRGMLGSAAKTLNNGLTQIGDTFNKEVDRTNQSKAEAQAGYSTKREDTTRAKGSALNTVNSGSRTLADSVRRMLGMASGTNSTAFNEAAPNLIARDATMKRAGVQETFGKNFRDIDSAETSTLNAFKQYLDDLTEQRNQKESGLREGVLQQEQGINQNLGQIARDREAVRGGGYDAMRRASAPYQAEVNSRQQQLDGLFERFRTPYQTRNVEVAKPQLADYTVDKTQLQAGGGTATGQESPYQQFLRKKFSADTL